MYVEVSSLQTHPYSLQFANQLTTAQGAIQGREGIIVCVASDSSLVGLGDAAPIAGFNPESLEEVTAELDKVKELLTGMSVPADPGALGALLEDLQRENKLSSSTVFAVESALADLASSDRGLTLSRWYNPQSTEKVLVNTLLSGEAEQLVERVQRAVSFGFHTFKLKLPADPEQAPEHVRKVREQLPAGAKLRVDANQAYDFDQAGKLLETLESGDIEYIEEPLKEPTHDALKELHQVSNVRIAMDESLVERSFLEACLGEPICGVFVLKPMSMGGIIQTLGVAARARAIGIETVVTSSLESAVGVTACIHTASALGASDIAHGLMTESMYDNSFASSTVLAVNGELTVPSAPGLGRTFQFPKSE